VDPEIHSFIVRIWKESREAPGAHSELRGSIDHVATGRRLYFRDLNGILRFIRENIGGGGSDQPSILENLREIWQRLKARFKHGSRQS